MSDGSPRAAAVAIVPCFNEGRNPLDLAEAILGVADLHATFVDDASDPESARQLETLARRDPRITVVRNPARVGKVESLVRAFSTLDDATARVLLVDADVVVNAAALGRVLDGLERADLVLGNARAIQRPRTFWERGAIFSANRHDRLRRTAFARYPALFSNGRLLGLSRRLVDAIVATGMPRHTEDAHFMLVCLTHGYAHAYLDDAVVQYRAPDALDDYLRQSGRFSAGRALLLERWPAAVIARYYDPRPVDLASSAAAQALRDPLGALAFGAMLAAKTARRGGPRPSGGAWAVAPSTKALR